MRSSWVWVKFVLFFRVLIGIFMGLFNFWLPRPMNVCLFEISRYLENENISILIVRIFKIKVKSLSTFWAFRSPFFSHSLKSSFSCFPKVVRHSLQKFFFVISESSSSNSSKVFYHAFWKLFVILFKRSS